VTPPASSTSPSKSNSAAAAKDLIEDERPQDPSESPRTFLSNKIESNEIPLEGDEVVKPEEPPPVEEAPEGSSVPPESVDHQYAKKPQDLTLSSDLISSTPGEGLYLPKSQDPVEPSSPDSFNTTQSVAGSEVPSISETEFMNRTTSVDEVEDFMNRTTSVDEVEDLPPEEFLLTTSRSGQEVRPRD